MTGDLRRARHETTAAMGTFVTITVDERGGDADSSVDASIERAFGWFHHLELVCSRFDPSSELMRLAAHPGVETPVSELLYRAVEFSLEMAVETRGAFDPTVGHALERAGFNRNYQTGERVQTPIEPSARATYRDVRLNPARKSITLLNPLVLDLASVVKGLAIDLAACELRAWRNYTIDAGGDLYVAGCSPDGDPWAVGIRHPRRDGELIGMLHASNRAVCTSGDYERVADDSEVRHHLIDPLSGRSAETVVSVTTIANSAMLADAAGTAAFVLGPVEGIALFDRLGIDGVIFSATMERFETRGMSSEYSLESPAAIAAARQDSSILPHAQGSAVADLRAADGRVFLAARDASDRTDTR